jgi:putative (di)nucleoside polyphosphate hydrolase
VSKKKKVRAEDLPYRPCVGIVLLNAEGKVWAGRRMPNTETFGKDAYLWQMPQGGIDKGEDPLPAAKRELWEETGITSASLLGEIDEWLNYDLPDELIGIGLRGKYRGQTQKWYAFRFEGSEEEINITHPPDGSDQEFDKWEWKDLCEMPDLIVAFKREIYERVVIEFAHLVD